MIRINLLPHREMRRERRKKDFIAIGALVAAAGVLAVFAVGVGINGMIAAQTDRNGFLQAENGKLDAQIKEIANLRAEIQSLRARQQAVENLQSDRTMPVHLLDELVRQVPEGVHVRSLKQEDLRVTLVGWAQSNERISELLRKLGNESDWLEKPELVEIKALTVNPVAGQPAKVQDGRRVYEFQLSAMLRRQDRKAMAPPVTAGAPADAAPLAAGTLPKGN